MDTGYCVYPLRPLDKYCTAQYTPTLTCCLSCPRQGFTVLHCILYCTPAHRFGRSMLDKGFGSQQGGLEREQRTISVLHRYSVLFCLYCTLVNLLTSLFLWNRCDERSHILQYSTTVHVRCSTLFCCTVLYCPVLCVPQRIVL